MRGELRKAAQDVLPQRRLRVLLLLTLSGVAYVGLKFVLTEHIGYLSLMWDVFLAWLSVPLTVLLVYAVRTQRQWWQQVLAFFAWLVVLPNSFYLVTNFYHIARINGSYIGRDTKMSDLTVEQALAVNIDIVALLLLWVVGTLVGLHAVRAAHRVCVSRFGRKRATVIVGVLLFGSSFGIYVGRFLRWNSWDAIYRSSDVIGSFTDIIVSPSQHLEAYGITFLLSVYLLILYAGFVYWSE